ncbi:Hypothetical predicted protein [Octopus vulgaris]|uniref:Uncharacterized protein n=1 Tax=Octopus vulgaris TaxID=6645 RepID=A0AA36BHR5_OCTVU|nr:Hypothetical predicted protein [Octopus vulgaris]
MEGKSGKRSVEVHKDDKRMMGQRSERSGNRARYKTNVYSNIFSMLIGKETKILWSLNQFHSNRKFHP